MQQQITLLKVAKGLIKKGFSVVATDSTKHSIPQWGKYQKELPSSKDIDTWFTNPKAKGIATICGRVSGDLEVIDIDTKHDVSGTLYENLCSEILNVRQELFDRLLIIETISGGKHFYYRCATIEGNQKLAQRPATEEELKENPNTKKIVPVLIETRGEGGYVISPPTPGYKVLQGESVPTITPEERELLLEICRSFNEYIVEEQKPTAARAVNQNYALTPWEDYNNRGDVIGLLEKHGWKVVTTKGERTMFKRPGNTESKTSGDFHSGKNLFAVFTTSTEFEPQKGYKPAAVFAMLECGGNFSMAAKRLSDLGYGEKKQSYGDKFEKELFQKKIDGYPKADLIKFVKSKLKKDTDEEATEVYETYEKQWGETLCTFWEVNDGKLSISRYKLERFLCDTGGFALYFYDRNSNIYRTVRVCDGFVEEASTEQIKKFIKSYIHSLPDTFDGGVTPNDLLEIIYKGSETYFSKSFFEFLDHIEPDLLKDSAEQAYFPFRNGVVVVDKDDIYLKSYSEIGKVIWKSQVIDFDASIDQHFDIDQCEFYRFIEKICGDEEDRILYAMSLIGYLLHTYKDPARPYAVILAEETDNEAEGGGTGKGILVKAISYLINTERVDGKNFKLDKNFAFQRVGLDTRLVSLEDVRKNVDFEGFFSIITEGITVEKKNKDELYIPFKDSPKILFTTNYTINNTSKASQRRQKVFEFSAFFGPKYTPKDHFKHNLFDDWDQDEWNRFYNFMFACVNMYLKAGVKEVQNSEKLKRKHIKLSFGEEFLEMWDHYAENGCEQWKPFTEMFNNFMIQNDFEKKDYSQKRYKKGLEVAAELYGWELKTYRNQKASGRREVRVDKKTGFIPDTNENPV